MRYLCTKCNYIYDESLGDKVEDFSSGTVVDNLFSCPNCLEYDTFHEIEDVVNYANDIENLDPLEIEHIPAYKIVGNNLKVFVGEEEHPMGENHRISSVTLYDEYGDIVDEKFLEQDEKPELDFLIGDLDDFEIRVRCNLHGVWGRKIKNTSIL